MGSLFGNHWSKAWYEIQVMAAPKEESSCDEWRVFLYRFDDNEHTKPKSRKSGVPTKIIVIDPTKEIFGLDLK
eukprot:CAMPEP_0113712458 /NCGR_PEP_ID=MMETSP0038_2-20120614/31398_1 /TAXON_ID=2898 /ORGANISM="Cryptomonas paramecium" /LENGTH=72 /DNA_ID=CAMNT_0000638977 /DNA_START=44 /DNA_END=259 /DNA_ORIENTATION=+ /assembly_acc=CAM_ASM_000170